MASRSEIGPETSAANSEATIVITDITAITPAAASDSPAASKPESEKT